MVKIGVVIPAWNEERFLGKTLECLLNQTRKPDVIVVVDDGFLDRTAEIAKQYDVTLLYRLCARGLMHFDRFLGAISDGSFLAN